MSARDGYEQAIATLRGVFERTGSPAAKWAADYLVADPDRLAPRAGVPVPSPEPPVEWGTPATAGSAQCASTSVHSEHEWIDGALRRACPGVDVTVARTRRPDYASAVDAAYEAHQTRPNGPLIAVSAVDHPELDEWVRAQADDEARRSGLVLGEYLGREDVLPQPSPHLCCHLFAAERAATEPTEMSSE